MLLNRLNEISVLNAVANARSLTQAGERLGLSASAVSKAVTRLERATGLVLVKRSTHRMALTEHGMLLCREFRRISDQLEATEAELLNAHAAPRGRLNVQLPLGIGQHLIMPRLGAFMRNYPELDVTIELSERVIDLSKERVELAVRIGEVAESNLIARRLFRLRYVLCAAPNYLERHPEIPRRPEDLDQHRCLSWFNPDTGRYGDWQFFDRGEIFVRTTPGSLSGRISVNNADALVTLGLMGEGIVRIAEFLAAPLIRSGQLVRVLQDYEAPGPDVHALYMPHVANTPNVRVFLNFIEQSIAEGLSELIDDNAAALVGRRTSADEAPPTLLYQRQRGLRVPRSRLVR